MEGETQLERGRKRGMEAPLRQQYLFEVHDEGVLGREG